MLARLSIWIIYFFVLLFRRRESTNRNIFPFALRGMDVQTDTIVKMHNNIYIPSE